MISNIQGFNQVSRHQFVILHKWCVFPMLKLIILIVIKNVKDCKLLAMIKIIPKLTWFLKYPINMMHTKRCMILQTWEVETEEESIYYSSSLFLDYEFRSKLRYVKVYFDTPTYDKITKDRAAKFVDQLSAIGGTMGLLTGFSIISGVEIIYFIMKTTTGLLNKLKILKINTW